MAGDAEAPLGAWVDYYRDLGVYDFYRRCEPAMVVDEALVSADAVEALAAESRDEHLVEGNEEAGEKTPRVVGAGVP